MPLKKHDPSFSFSGNKVSADEIDQKIHYHVQNPSVSASYLGTVESAAASAAVVLDAVRCDYPRTLLLSLTGVAGGMGGTVHVVGTDQFGVSQTEDFGFGSAAGGGTKAGTKIFDSVTAATVTIDGLGGTAIGTTALGFAIGTAANIVAWFGLPARIGAGTDVKNILWNDNATMKAVNGGTVSGTAYVDTTRHAFRHNEIVAAADGIYATFIPSYKHFGEANIS